MLVIDCDATKQEEATEAVEHTVSELGRLDTLVNNAGVMLLGPAVDVPLSEWQRMVDPMRSITRITTSVPDIATSCAPVCRPAVIGRARLMLG